MRTWTPQTLPVPTSIPVISVLSWHYRRQETPQHTGPWGTETTRPAFPSQSPWMQGAACFHTPHPGVSASPPQPRKMRHGFCDRTLRGNADTDFFKSKCPRGLQAGGNCCRQTPPQTELPDPQAKQSHLHLQSLKLNSTGNSAPQSHEPHFQCLAPSVTTGTHPAEDQCGTGVLRQTGLVLTNIDSGLRGIWVRSGKMLISNYNYQSS